MPGLVGFIADDVRDKQLLDKMVRSIAHEQWYRTDIYIGRPFNVARVHHGIFNPEPQPIFNEDRTMCVFMDGKVYGYEEEKKRLEENHRFASDNDPEFCLHLYEELGTESFKKLNGNFVLLICDLRQKKTIIANDRNCLRSFYYAAHAGSLLFAPEAKAILQDGTIRRELDVEALAMSMAWGEFWDDKTLIEGIHFLPPASILAFSEGKLSRSRYWDINYHPDYALSDAAIVEQLTAAIRKAVAIRMKDSLRHGISLSGGLDSRSVLAAVEPGRRKDIVSYSYGPLDCDEVRIGEKVAAKAGTLHRSIEITPRLIIENAEQESWRADGRNSTLVGYFHAVHKLIRDDVDVVFDGLVFGSTAGGGLLNKRCVQGQSKHELFSDYQRDRRLIGDDGLLGLFAPKYHKVVREAPLKTFEAVYSRLSIADPKTAFDQFYWSTHVAYWPTWHVYIRDLMEISYPTVDNDLIDLIFSIPPEKRLNHRIYRPFLQRLSPELAGIPYAKTMLPPSWPLVFWNAGRAYGFGREKLKLRMYKASGGRVYLRNRRKYVDEVGWMRTDEGWKRYFRELLLDKRSALAGYLQQDYIKYLIEQHEKGVSDNAPKILRLASTELFLREVLI